MAIQREFCGRHVSKRRLIRTYSDAGLQIRRADTGEVYKDGEAVDVEGVGHTYEELPERAVHGPEEEQI